VGFSHCLGGTDKGRRGTEGGEKLWDVWRAGTTRRERWVGWVIESDGDGMMGGKGGRRETRRRERGSVEPNSLREQVDPAPAVRCRVESPLRPGDPKSPNLSLPSHTRLLSPPSFIYLGTCICIVLVDSTIATETWGDGRLPYNP
jgi:hypothetical protein